MQQTVEYPNTEFDILSILNLDGITISITLMKYGLEAEEYGKKKYQRTLTHVITPHILIQDFMFRFKQKLSPVKKKMKINAKKKRESKAKCSYNPQESILNCKTHNCQLET